MDALRLHHALFTHGNDSDLPLRSATFLHPAPERDGGPTSQLFTYAPYQDLIQRQPTHPDGPTSGWDLGLSLLGDPITAAECKSLEDHQIKMKLRRLHAINITFELLFGIWGAYATVRYFLASSISLNDATHICAIIFGIMSALAVALVAVATLIPLLPRISRPHVWRHMRRLLRASYLLLLFAGAVVNLILVLVWHPNHLCNWDIDITWYTSTMDTIASPCRAAPFAAWISAAILRLAVMVTLTFSFIYTLRLCHRTRHPNFDGNSPKYSSYLLSDPEDISPVFRSSPLHSKSTFKLTRSEDSSHTLNQSNTTLPKSNSISTLAPSTSCTGHSRSHSIPPTKDISPPRISSPASRRTSTHVTNHGVSSTFSSETPSQTQPIDAVTPPLSGSHMLRRTSRISIAQVTPDTVLTDDLSHSERASGSILTRDSSQIRSCKPTHCGASVQLDARKTAAEWENTHVRYTSQTSVGLRSFSSTEGESVKEMESDDDMLAYSYGYGASGPTYPYLDTYNPPRPGRYAPSCEDAEECEFPQGYRLAIPGGPALPEVSSEPRSSFSGEEEESSSGEEEEYVAMMGGFVCRMATIESLGSKEAAGTLSTTGSVAPYSMRSKTPVSQFSSVRFAEHGSTGTSSLGMPLSTDGSLSTAYFSFSSGGTGVRVNERGELLWGHNAGRSAAGSPHDRRYYTASGSSFPRTDDDEDR